MIRIFFFLTFIFLSVTAAFAEGGKDVDFPELDGYEINTSNYPVYVADDLWEYINGGAYTYENFQFVDLHIAEYTKGDLRIKAEIYRHKNNVFAFGMYAQERAPDYSFIKLGVQGYAENTLVNFVKGAYYVKIICNDGDDSTKPVLLKLARLIESNIDGTDNMPEIFSKFPADGKIANSEAFIATEFLGYGFMPGVYTVSYEKDGKDLKLFIIKTDDAKKVIDDLKTKADNVKKMKRGILSLNDPYNGKIIIKKADNLIYGCTGNCDMKLFNELCGI